MKILREAFTGITAALTTSLLVLGAIVLAITEGMVLPPAEPIQDTATQDPLEPPRVVFTTPTQIRKLPLVPVATQPVATSCPPPPGWVPYTVRIGDNLKDLAAARQTTVDQVTGANCLEVTGLRPNSVLYLPPAPTPTATPLIPTATRTPFPTQTRCGPPAGWVRYLVRPGDTLFKIATLYGTTWPVLQKANCMGTNSMIFPGNSIYVPNVTPRYTATSRPLPSATAIKPSATRTITSRPTFTLTPSFTPISPTRTFTPTFTSIPPSSTFTSTATSIMPTSTFTPTSTSIPPTSTFTPTSTSIPPTSTFTPTPTPTPIPPPATPSPTSTSTPSGTNLSAETSTPTAATTASKYIYDN